MASVYADARYKLLPSTVVVLVTWWLGLTVYDVLNDPVYYITYLNPLISSSIATAAWWGLGLLIGSSATLLYLWHRREVIRGRLGAGALRSYKCSIGPVPTQVSPPKSQDNLPPLETFDWPDDDNPPSAEIKQWLSAAKSASPAHHELMIGILKVLARYEKAPATHIKGGHGGRSLIQHSLLTGQVALGVARTWEYHGKKNSKTGKLEIPLVNPHYVFDRLDPLIPLIAVAHDIGKIAMYQWDDEENDVIRGKDGNVIIVRKDHDTPGAQMLARMNETWNLPDEDRRILLTVVGHYHKPQMVPLDSQRRAVSDREHALMELLIKCDGIAGKVESGEYRPDVIKGFAELAAQIHSEDETEAPPYSPEQLWQAFLALVSEPGVVSGKDVFSSRAIGQKSNGLVFLKEAELRLALLARLGLSGTHRYGDGRYKLTQDLMETLEKRGLLYREHNGLTYSHKRALFRVRFINSKDGKTYGPWPTVVVVIPGPDLPVLASLANHPSNYDIERPVFGENSALNKAGLDSEDPSQAKASIEESSSSHGQESRHQEETPGISEMAKENIQSGSSTKEGAPDLEALLALTMDSDQDTNNIDEPKKNDQEDSNGEDSNGIVGDDPQSDSEGLMAWQKPKTVDERAEAYNRKVEALPYRSAKKLGRQTVMNAASEQARIAAEIMDSMQPEMDLDGLAKAAATVIEMALAGHIAVVLTPNHGYLVALSEAKKAVPTFSWEMQIELAGEHLTSFEVVLNKQGKPYLKLEALNRPENTKLFEKPN